MIIVCSTSSASSKGAHQNDTDDNDVDYESGEDDSFFFPRFFPRPFTPLGQEASQARSLQLLFTADDRAEGPVAGGAARPVARATDEDAGPVADDNAEGPVARGGDAARTLADR